jgi:hypothetical protein
MGRRFDSCGHGLDDGARGFSLQMNTLILLEAFALKLLRAAKCTRLSTIAICSFAAKN